MTDTTSSELLPGLSGSLVKKRLVDMGDGTYAEMTVTTLAASTNSVGTVNLGALGGAATAANQAIANASLGAIANGCGTVGATAPIGAELCGVLTSDGKLRAMGGAAFHASDNLALAGATYGPLVGAVSQVVNASGNLDRVREGYADAMTATGFAGAIAMVFNGTTFDRARSATAAQATSGTGLPASAGFGQYAPGQPALASGQYAALRLDVDGTLRVSGPTLSQIASPYAAATSTPLSGSVSDTTAHLLGPFVPQLARDIWLTLNATASASGTAQLLRSTDGGTTRVGLTAGGQPWASFPFSGAVGAIVNEQIASETDAAATYYLSITLTAGAVAWRIAQ